MRWGIMGPGNIIKRVSKSFDVLENHSIYAIGSRSSKRAEAAAELYGAVKYYGSYNELVDDKDVDAIYIATPHPQHIDCAILALEAGMPVLCEKPITINADEARKMAACAKKNGVFLMEAMWSRFFPVTLKAKSWIAEGLIGDVRQVWVDFGGLSPFDPQSRIFNPDLAGGALLDVGIYTVSFVSNIMNGVQPEIIKSIADIGSTGVDEQNAVIFGYSNGQLAMLSSAVRTTTDHTAIIYGTKGSIEIKNFWHPVRAVLKVSGQETEYVNKSEAEGFEYEIEEVERCLKAGLLESPLMTWKESIDIMETMDKIKADWDK